MGAMILFLTHSHFLPLKRHTCISLTVAGFRSTLKNWLMKNNANHYVNCLNSKFWVPLSDLIIKCLVISGFTSSSYTQIQPYYIGISNLMPLSAESVALCTVSISQIGLQNKHENAGPLNIRYMFENNLTHTWTCFLYNISFYSNKLRFTVSTMSKSNCWKRVIEWYCSL